MNPRHPLFATLLLALHLALTSCGGGGGGGPRKPKPVLLPATVASSSPATGESAVALTRETVVRFSAPLDPASVTPDALSASAGGVAIAAQLHLDPAGRVATLFYPFEDLPPSALVRVRVDGDRLRDRRGEPIDADGDGVAGGVGSIDFTTIAVAPVKGTQVTGTVVASELNLAGTNVPLEGVTISIDGTTRSVLTDAFGNFRLEDAPGGDFFVHIDGGTAVNTPSGFYYPNVGKRWTTLAGAENRVGTIHLPAVSENALTPVSEEEDTEVRLVPEQLAQVEDPELREHLAEVSVTVPAGSLFAADGTRGGSVGLAPVAPDRLPGELPPGLEFPLVITLQAAGGSNFDVPVPVAFPNLPDPLSGETLAAGERSALWSFNHDSGRFEVVGTLTVSADGRLLESDPGVGILAPGWHGARPGSQLDQPPPKVTPPPPPVQDPPQPEPIEPPPPSECPSLTSSVFWGVVAGVEECLANLSASLKLFHQGIKLKNDIRQIKAEIATIRAQYQAGDLSCAEALSAICAVESAVNNSAEAVKVWLTQNPVSKGKEAVQCAKDLVKGVVDQVCENPDCHGFTVKVACKLVVPVIKLADKVFALITSIEDFVAGSPGKFLTASFGLLKDLLNNACPASLPAGASASTDGETRDAILAAFDAVLLDYEAFDAGLDLEPLVTEAEALEELVERQRDEDILPLYASALGFAGEYWRLQLGENELRGRFNGAGQLSLPVAPGTDYRFEILIDGRDTVAVAEGQSPLAGVRAEFGPYRFERLGVEPDPDGDGLVDAAEAIVGTDPNDFDTDGDGLSDGAELTFGTDPLDGLGVRTGVVASVDTPGSALDVCAVDGFVALADGSEGISLFNATDPFNPLLVARVDTPGVATDVASARGRLAVVDGSALVVIDVSQPASAAILHELPFPGESVVAVAVAGDLAYAGTQQGGLHTVDLESGRVLDSLFLPAAVVGLEVGGGVLYGLNSRRLFTLALEDGLPRLEDDRATSAQNNRSLFVGTELLYVVHQRGYDSYSLADPLAPQEVAAGSTQQLGWQDLASNGAGSGVAAVGPNSGSGDAALYDLTDPAVVDAFVAGFETPGSAGAVTLFDGLAFVADGNSGLQVINPQAYDALGVAPTVTLASDLSAGEVEEGRTFHVRAAVSDDVQVGRVEFRVDGLLVATDGNHPFELTWRAPLRSEAESLTLEARAIDTGGNRTDAAPLVVAVLPDQTPPTVREVVPAPDFVVPFGQTLDTLQVRFSEDIDPSTLAAALVVERPGPDLVFDTEDDVLEEPSALDYNPSAQVAVLSYDPPLRSGSHRASVGPQLRDRTGNALAEAFVWSFRVQGIDSDFDGLLDDEELDLGTDPNAFDTDGDGLGDGAELSLFGTDPLEADSDDDGLEDGTELGLGTDPNLADSDGDGLEDGAELNVYSTSPTIADSDGDGLEDGEEVLVQGTDPQLEDTDGDGLGDGDEVLVHQSDPQSTDTDGDGLGDFDEVTSLGTDPTLADGDGDGVDDPTELALGTDPNQASAATRVTGRVRAPGNQAAPGAQLSLEGIDPALFAVVSDSAGRFAFPLLPSVLGSVQVNATWTDAGGAAHKGSAGPLALQAGGDTDVGDLLVQPAVGQGERIFPAWEVAFPNPNPFHGAFASGDFDRDGREDLAVTWSDFFEGEAGVRVRLGLGAGRFDEPVDYAVGDNPDRVLAADLDGDGAPDLAVVGNDSDADQLVIWWNRGDGRFESPSYFEPAAGTHALAAGDLDGDGRLDLAVGGESGDLSLYRNQGGRNFALQTSFSVPVTPNDLVVSDLDGDGLGEILFVGLGLFDALYVLEAQGSFSYTTQKVQSSERVRHLAVADLDGDGFPEVATSTSLSTTHQIWIYPNLAGDLGVAEKLAVPVGVGGLALEDVTGDGLRDLVFSGSGGSPGVGGFGLRPNAGGGSFGPAELYRVTAFGTQGLSVADFDGDGSADLATASEESVVVLAARPEGGFPTNHYLGDLQVTVETELSSLDFDGDALADLVTLGDDELRWSAGRGDGRFEDAVRVPLLFRPVQLASGDLDGDGDADLVVGDGDQGRVLVFSNSGSASFGTPLDLAVPGWGQSLEAFSDLEARDVDGDGDLDLIAVVWRSRGLGFLVTETSVLVFANDGSGSFGAPRETRFATLLAQVEFAFLNGDGRLDLVGTQSLLAKPAFSLGQSGGSFGTLEDLPQGGGLIGEIGPLTVADFDGDGRAEVVGTRLEPDFFGGGDTLVRLVLWHWKSGGGFAAPEQGPVLPEAPRVLRASDLSGNGRPDLLLLLGEGGAATFAVLEARSDGTLEEPVFHAGLREPEALVTGDWNGDALTDVALIGDALVAVLLNQRSL